MNGFINSLKNGFSDIRFVINDGKGKLLLTPVIAGAVLCFVIYSYNNYVQKAVGKEKAEILSLKTQREKMSGFTANKNRVAQIEKFFPNIADKNEWLVTQIIQNFESNNMRYTFTGSQTEEGTDNILVASIGLNFKTHFAGAVKLMMDFENAKTYTKVQELIFSKDDRDMGSNLFSAKFSTAFVKNPSGAQKPGGGQ